MPTTSPKPQTRKPRATSDPVPDPLVPKHVRFGQGAYERAELRAAGDGRTLIDVLRAFVVKYGNGELPAP